MRSSCHFKIISRLLILAMLHLCWLTSYGYAEMLPTESAVQPQVQDDRQRILDLLNRQELIDELGKYGITKVEAVARINSLTDEDVAEISGKLDELPKGGASNTVCLFPCKKNHDLGAVLLIVLGVLVLILVIIWVYSTTKNHSTSYTPKEWPTSGQAEEDCDPGMESCA